MIIKYIYIYIYIYAQYQDIYQVGVFKSSLDMTSLDTTINKSKLDTRPTLVITISSVYKQEL
jgi:hypothetical protein